MIRTLNQDSTEIQEEQNLLTHRSSQIMTVTMHACMLPTEINSDQFRQISAQPASQTLYSNIIEIYMRIQNVQLIAPHQAWETGSDIGFWGPITKLWYSMHIDTAVVEISPMFLG